MIRLLQGLALTLALLGFLGLTLGEELRTWAIRTSAIESQVANMEPFDVQGLALPWPAERQPPVTTPIARNLNAGLALQKGAFWATNKPLDFSADFSLEFWFIPTDLTPPPTHRLINLLWIGQPPGQTQASLWIDSATRGLHFSSFREHMDLFLGGIKSNQPHHVALTYQAKNQQFRLFLDLVEKKPTGRHQGPAPQTGQLLLGKGFGPPTYFTGLIGGLALRQRAYQTGEPSSLVKSPLKIKAWGLLFGEPSQPQLYRFFQTLLGSSMLFWLFLTGRAQLGQWVSWITREFFWTTPLTQLKLVVLGVLTLWFWQRF
ncbi:MAG: hypothetical protein A2508_07155 [Candidatus Lambdaproteobacteria bacterium RIFOXYD12_FULL_49_8]|uniref:Uncharacterized protein n=1 Tax=Candidatus Lambdaproteobacteria bacterium RIFOXYD2_FULL_50_16 TaxID=1817772 RepID=A0A1F6GFP8_9PROT|nr:MAG: hypothetical protein A2527_00135 [Candidatus Lambdaproteobacteria bacterium RIFOXYD2_FULL_50_16]OGG97468.1 MAG: hypothetical protein A2508_07155 [Candidatus Lambdaproteobacteria bacterium RIFOXYD12_FULL_49_8]